MKPRMMIGGCTAIVLFGIAFAYSAQRNATEPQEPPQLNPDMIKEIRLSSGPEPSFSAPGTIKAETRSQWIAPYVRQTVNNVGEAWIGSVVWYTPKGKVRRELAMDPGGFGASITGFVQTEGKDGAEKIYGTADDWEITLPKGGSIQNGPIHGTRDSRVLVRERSDREGELAVEVYVSGKRVGTLGPFLSYSGGISLGADGSLALVAGTDSMRNTQQVIVAGPDGRERFRVPLPGPSSIESVAPRGAGVLIASNPQTTPRSFSLYGPSGRVTTVQAGSNARALAWLPDSLTALIHTNDGNEDAFQLIDWEKGARIWKVANPTRIPLKGIAPNAAIAGSYVLLPQGEYPFPSAKVYNRSIYALDIKTGKTVAHWTPSGFRVVGYSWDELDTVLTVGSHTYFITADEFGEIDLNDVAGFKHGWRPVS